MFSLQAAQNGAYMLTKEGYEAKFVTVLADKKIPARLVVEVAKGTSKKGIDYGFEMVNYYLDGSFAGCNNHPMDLVIVHDRSVYFTTVLDDSKLPWVNNHARLKKSKSPSLHEYRNLGIMRMLKKKGWTMDHKSDYFFDESLLPAQQKEMVKNLTGTIGDILTGGTYNYGHNQ